MDLEGVADMDRVGPSQGALEKEEATEIRRVDAAKSALKNARDRGDLEARRPNARGFLENGSGNRDPETKRPGGEWT